MIVQRYVIYAELGQYACLFTVEISSGFDVVPGWEIGIDRLLYRFEPLIIYYI